MKNMQILSELELLSLYGSNPNNYIWNEIFYFYKIPENIVINYIDIIPYDDLQTYPLTNKLSEYFIYQYLNCFSPIGIRRIISGNKKNITNRIICKYIENCSFRISILSKKRIQEKILRKYIHIYTNFDWYNISQYQKLSENFIIEFSDKIDWKGVSRIQKLSKEFIINYWSKLDPIYLLENKNISKECKKYVRLFL